MQGGHVDVDQLCRVTVLQQQVAAKFVKFIVHPSSSCSEALKKE